MAHDIIVLGIFVADTSYRAPRQPRIGETILGSGFSLGPGGKGSNQAVAAARAGGDVGFITKLGRDAFADMALAIWADAGVVPLSRPVEGGATGAAFIFVDEATGDNAIIVAPGVAQTLSPADIDAHEDAICSASVVLTQLEQPLDAAERMLELARRGGAVTILNPAPATGLSDRMLALCDYITPNESEAETLTGMRVRTLDDARPAAAALLEKGVGAVVVTLGENGALYHDGARALHVPAIDAGPVAETTGAGDAFNGALAAALAKGRTPEDAVRFANAAAALSVTRPGAASAMAGRAEIEALLRRGAARETGE